MTTRTLLKPWLLAGLMTLAAVGLTLPTPAPAQERDEDAPPPPPRDELTVETDSVVVGVEQAIPIGLILNELLSNAAKYGRSEDGICRVVVALTAHDEGFDLRVSDRGPGLPGPWSALPRRSLGTRIITSLARQLRARIETPSAEGFCFVLSITS